MALLGSAYNIDAALYILPRYLHQLEAPGADLAEVRSSACRCMEDFLRATDEGREVKLDRTKWLILRVLLKALEASLEKAMETQMASYASTSEGDIWESNKGIFTAIENMDKIHVQYFEGSTPTSLRIAFLRRHPETASLQHEVEQHKKLVEELKADLKKKSDVVDSFVLQGGLAKMGEMQSKLEAQGLRYNTLCSQYSKEKKQLAELQKKCEEVQHNFELERQKTEEDMKALEEKYEKTFRDLIVAQKFREDLQAGLERANLQLEDQSRLQEEIKNIVQRIEEKQDDLPQELRLEAPAQTPDSALDQLPADVNLLCMQIQYFIGAELSAFGSVLLGGDFNRGSYETDGACFATSRVFWRLIRQWVERSRDSVTEQNLRCACANLRFNPLERTKMSDAKKNQLEKNYVFLVKNILLSELAPKLMEVHVFDLEDEAKNYVMHAGTTGERVKRLLQVVFSWGDAGFDHLVLALSQSHPDFVARELTSGMQQEAAEGEEAAAGGDAAPAAADAGAEEPGRGSDTDREEEQPVDVDAELFGDPVTRLSVPLLAQAMMSLCQAVLQQRPLDPPTPPAP